MKQKKLSDFKYNKPSFIKSLLIYKNRSIFHKIYYWLIDFSLFYKNKKTLKYSIISLSGEIIDFSFLILFTEFFNIFYLFSAIGSYILALLNNFFLNLKFTFKYKPKNVYDLLGSFINYLLVSIFGLLLNILILSLFVEIFKINYIVAKLCASIIIFMLLYTGHNFVLGKKKFSVHK
jgi:putative flippase GtrA